MLTQRIIPCLDVKDGQVVKGTNFNNLEYAGDAIELAKRYYEEGADELVFLDITASIEKRKTIIDLVKEVAKNVFIPFTVGGGISSIDDIRNILGAGADKISINSSAVKNPDLIKKASEKFGSQCIVIAIDAKKVENVWKVFINGGRIQTDLDVIKWAKTVEQLGAGEILLTSMDRDGTKKGFDIDLTKIITKSVNIPVIASGGVGSIEDFCDVFKKTDVNAALAASVFHYNKYSIDEVKNYLRNKQIKVRK